MYLKITSIHTRPSVDLPWPTVTHPDINMPNVGLRSVPAILKTEEISPDQLTMTRSGYYDPSFDYAAFKQQPENLLLREKSVLVFPKEIYQYQEIVELVDSLPE